MTPKKYLSVLILLLSVIIILNFMDGIKWANSFHDEVVQGIQEFEFDLIKQKKCLADLNRDTIASSWLMEQGEKGSICHTLNVKNGTGIAAGQLQTFDFCFCSGSRWLTATVVKKCGIAGYLIRDRSGAQRAFLPSGSDRILKKFMRRFAFPRSKTFAEISWGMQLIFFNDLCNIELFDGYRLKVQGTLKCKANYFAKCV